MMRRAITWACDYVRQVTNLQSMIVLKLRAARVRQKGGHRAGARRSVILTVSRPS